MEEFAVATTAVSVGKTLFYGLDFIRGMADASVSSAYFKWDGSRIAGNNNIEIERRADGNFGDNPPPPEQDGRWWFSVKEVQDY